MHITAQSRFKESQNYISKIAQTILRDRIQPNTTRSRTKSEPLEASLLHSRTKSEPTGLKNFTKETVNIHSLSVENEFWNQGVPLHIDLVTTKGVVVERWILSFTVGEYLEAESRDVLQDYQRDFSEWKLLLQSLYSKLRGFPLSLSMMSGAIDKSQMGYCLSTSQGISIDHISNIKAFLYHSDREFDSMSTLNSFKFKSSAGPLGTLNLSVVYDTNLTKLEKENVLLFDFTKLKTALDNKQDTIDYTSGTVITAGSFCEKEELPQALPTSPFPSPKLPKKNVQKPLPNVKHKRSNLYITISRSSSTSSLESPDEGEENQLLNRDGIEIRHQQTDSISVPQNRRRSSVSSELYGSFVGSYEESILMGRMSTSPSKPIHFIADIGALATAKCKSSLKCPPHLIVSFPAFFYQLPGEDVPSPYVGAVDFAVYVNSKKKEDCKLENGCYRLPPKGQLQIMIKNPKCTAIKIFLIPYDFQDMPPNSKTFIRQKSYCIQKNPNIPHEDRLRFAIHLNFRMTHHNHLLLTSGPRVVFSPRPLESDETLKIVYQGPTNPKYIPLSESPQVPWPVSVDDQAR